MCSTLQMRERFTTPNRDEHFRARFVQFAGALAKPGVA
jgi:hypothetical protein